MRFLSPYPLLLFAGLLLFLLCILAAIADESAALSGKSPSPAAAASLSPLLPPASGIGPAVTPLPSPTRRPVVNRSAHSRIIHTRTPYGYGQLMKDCKALCRKYPSLVRMYSLGKTPGGRDIPLLIVGNPDAPSRVWVDASLHGREYMTSQIVMNQLEFLLGNAKKGVFEGKRLRDVLSVTALHVAPMLNPDGVELCRYGLSSVPMAMHNELLLLNDGSDDFSLWKANLAGVDLNRNFPTGWDALPAVAPGYAGHKGVSPLSQPESALAARYLQSMAFVLSVSYHCVGGEIYWYFGQEPPAYERDLAIVNGFAALTGYRPVAVEDSTSGGGLKDFVVSTLKIPAITVELYSPKPAPIPQRYFKRIFAENAFVLWHAVNLVS